MATRLTPYLNFPEGTRAAMEYYRELGCVIVLDDFGAGHSNFDRIWRLNPDIVKIDREMTRRVDDGREEKGIPGRLPLDRGRMSARLQGKRDLSVMIPVAEQESRIERVCKVIDFGQCDPGFAQAIVDGMKG